MRFVMFYHSLVSDWNHGNAHFLRGVASELQALGHRAVIYEPAEGWSRTQLERDHGKVAVRAFASVFPELKSRLYRMDTLDLDKALAGADVVIVHEWNDPELVARIGSHRAAAGRYRLFFHDTHHRMATAPHEMARYDLRHYDGVLAFGRIIADLYVRRGHRAWTWHEAADARVFRPSRRNASGGDLVWIGNWGDEERSRELLEMLLHPVLELGLKARVYGVRYPAPALRALERAGIEYGGWLPNYAVPEIFGRYRLTVHVPRRPYREKLHGIPTIRVFEALACGIPLICLRWSDSEQLFTSGKDYLEVDSGREMTRAMRRVLSSERLAHDLAEHGHRTILRRHTCAHRVHQLLRIVEACQRSAPSLKPRAAAQRELEAS
ncbi:MAG TPA: glycosyltransferase [Candidatus Limnocylindrales bacterium]|nr:glycosyltransferase [Candidatus Limnocylindrales bacterium]